VAPEDDDLSGDVEENVEVVEDSDASKEDKEAEEEEEEEEDDDDDDDDDAPFTARHRRAAADKLIDTVESSPSGQNDDEADRNLPATAAPEASTAPASKRPSGFFAHKDDLMSDS
jgi:hypothetical protein